ncbi:MAG TPA: ABC transporter permease, partial [Chloroflexota bacterium]|nr:ABC transporter permease [Chloroflexota bacterium]
MSVFRQVGAITRMNLGALPQRPGAAIVTVIGVASVVAVLLSLLAIGAGVRRAIDVTDQPERAVVLSGSAPNEFMGNFTPAQVAQVSQAPGIRLDAQGRPMVQPLAAILVEVKRKKDGATDNLMLRGTGRIGDAMNHASMHLVAGRIYTPGLHELVVGRQAQKAYRNLELGDEVLLRGTPWKVVGVYADQGGWNENAVSGDVDTVLAAFGRDGYQSVGVMLKTPGDYGRFRDALMSNPQLSVTVKRLGQYYRDQSRGL